jgi:hypothetical protein
LPTPDGELVQHHPPSFERSAVTVVDDAANTFTQNSVAGKGVTFRF